jgi:hypothetical protein
MERNSFVAFIRSIKRIYPLPLAIVQSPAATAAPEPLDEPAGSCSTFQGLRAGGNGVSKAVPPIANSQVVNLPNRIAPASLSSRVVVASLAADRARLEPGGHGRPRGGRARQYVHGIMAAGAFHAGHPDVAEIATAYEALTPLLGAAAAGAFLVSLVASGVSSSVVGTLAGQMIMQGFVGFAIPIWLRRLVTMLPAFIVVAIGVDPTEALVLSQVVLSIPCHFQWSRLCCSPGASTSWAASPTAARPKPRRLPARPSCWRSTPSWSFKPLMCSCSDSSDTSVANLGYVEASAPRQ